MATKISVVIPNYNGRDILTKTLPYVIKNCPNSEIIVVDDASSDDSVTLLHKKFKKVRVVRLKKNKGFANAANSGILTATNKLVLLLNSDVAPRNGFLNPALKYFNESKNKVFAVGLCDFSHENGRIVKKGRGGIYFKQGFLLHYPAVIERGATLWTSGGSSLINREIFLKLGGFDTLFKPFYWEDIDLGWRAWKQGYKCFFEPLSIVDHYHEQGSIIKEKSKLSIKTASYKNQILFFWKNVEDTYFVIMHLILFPYNFLTALIRLDIAFFAGFLWAIIYVPCLIYNKTLSPTTFIISEREILKIFEK
ncbi:MAG: glycosyltransferase family 2 protein [Patescibacteria group bacterium]